ncbi:prolipoprotein diacylglyceryl transferase [Candidatus Woesearchaeota archaeon]|nr:prolipoprotein diacylglyceryl transferase [Candidatus Woesearchaeota archaeon]RLE43577.1 MAG: prolipoprotein diacylglyceryl transferase [Candidatus Woesearchaeota archaeon]
MFYHNINPVLLKLGSLEIRYYGLMYVVGIAVCYLIVARYSKRLKLGITKQQIQDILFWGVLGLLLGGRLGYCLFYNPGYFLSHPLDIVKIWEGGMSFHGGLLGALLLTWIYSKRHSLPFLKLADLFVLPVPIALAFGRLGNFINGELYGRPCNCWWGFYFPNAPDHGLVPRHPSQIYEMLKNLFIFLVLWVLSNRKHKPGFLLFSFIFLYGLLRFIVEFLRAPEIVFMGVTMGQWLSIPMIVIGGAWILLRAR